MLVKSDFGLDPATPGSSCPGPVKQAPEGANRAELPASIPGLAQETGGLHADCSQAGTRGEHGIPCLLHSMHSALYGPYFAWPCSSIPFVQLAGRVLCQMRSEHAWHAAGQKCGKLDSGVREAPETPGNQHAVGNACTAPPEQRTQRSVRAGDAVCTPTLRCCSLLHMCACTCTCCSPRGTARLALRHYLRRASHVPWRGV